MTQKKHILITGGAGFIGSHLTEVLLGKGYAITVVDNFLTGRKENLANVFSNENFDFLEWNVSRPLPKDKIKFLNQYGLHGLFHFACPASPVDFEKLPFEILEVDSLGTMNTVDLAFEYNARFMLASTSEIYGDPLVHPQTEDYFGNVNTIGPRACYDETKRFAEAYVTSAARGTGLYKGKPYNPLNVGIVRIFNTYGPRMRPDDGRVVPELCMQALQNKPLTVCGKGLQTRSFCYVSDLVDGIVRLFESDVRVPVNIGNPVERTIIEFAQTVIDILKSKSTITYLPERPDDPKKRKPNITRAQTLLGWQPKVDLKEGLEKTIEYFKSEFKK